MNKVIFICTSGKDRSPALVEYFKATRPENEYRSAGVNKYFTLKNETHYLTIDDLAWADTVIFCEQIHKIIVERDFQVSLVSSPLVLSLGEYKHGQVGEDYVVKAEIKINEHLAWLEKVRKAAAANTMN